MAVGFYRKKYGKSVKTGFNVITIFGRVKSDYLCFEFFIGNIVTTDNPYRQLFCTEGVTGFFIAGLIARFPLGMVTLGTVLMFNSTHGGFGLPSLVASTAILACALIAPQLSRLTDAHGQTRIAVPAVCITLASYAGLIATSFLHWPGWALFISAIGMARIRPDRLVDR